MQEPHETTLPRKRSTVRDVAALAGVHHASVSVALNSAKGGTGLSVATRERIIEAARLLDYRPNSAAKTVRSGRFDCIGLILGTKPNHSSILPSTLHGINTALLDCSYHLTIATLPDEDLTDDETLPKMLKQRMLDGLIINYTAGAPAQLKSLVRRHSIPSIWINTADDTDSVHPDDWGAARKATEQLVALGHRNIEYWGYDFRGETPIHYSVTHRRGGYEEAMAAAQLPAKCREIYVDRTTRGYDSVVERALSSADRPTAIVTYWPSVANAIYGVGRGMGFSFPEDLTIVTFSEIWQKDEALQVATCLIPTFEYGRQAVEMLIERIENPAKPLPSRAIPYTYDLNELPQFRSAERMLQRQP